MAVGFLTRDFNGVFPDIIPGGCSYYRCFLPMTVAGQRAKLGMPVFDPIRGFGVKDQGDTGIFGFGTIVLKLIMDRPTAKQIQLAQNLGQRVIVDVDDFYEGIPESNRAFEVTHPDRNKWTNRENYQRVIAAADTVTVSTPFLLEHHSRTHSDVRLIRNGVDMNHFKTRKRPNRKPIIGWAGAVSYRGGDLETLRDWLPGFLDEHDLKFHHAGHTHDAASFADVSGIDPDRLRTSPLVTIDKYPSGFVFDIGIVPLSDIPFNYAKSNIKGLEYAAAGIPYVAAAAPEYVVLENDSCGRTAVTSEDWVREMTRLLDRGEWQRDAQMNRDTVSQRWSIEARTGEWVGLFTS